MDPAHIGSWATPAEADRPKKPSKPLYEGEWRLSPELREREERRARQSWRWSFGGGANKEAAPGANETAMLRNISALRPDWSPEKVAEFYETQILPEVTRAINETPIGSYEEVGNIPRSIRKGGNLGFHSRREGDIGSIAIDRSGRHREWPTTTHEIGHAVQGGVDRAFGRHLSKAGEYGDIGADLLARNERARKKAFPFSKTYEEASPWWMKPQGRSRAGDLMWGRVPHAEQAPEVQNVMRELRRHLGRDPTAEEIRHIVSQPGRGTVEPWRGTPGSGIRLPTGMNTEDIRDHFWTENPARPATRPEVLRSGAPSFEDIAKAIEEFSYTLPAQQPETLLPTRPEGLVSPEMMSKMVAAS